MPDPFSNPEGDPFSVAPGSLLDELATAISERAAVIGAGAFALPAAGSDAQHVLFWRNLQIAALSNPDAWADHGVADGDSYAGLTEIPSLTSDRVFELAGLPNGWRRLPAGVEWDFATDDWRDLANPKYAHGIAEPGDALGPWIIEDLQRVVSVFRHALRSVEDVDGIGGAAWYRGAGINAGDPWPQDAAEAFNLVVANWAGAAWLNAGFFPDPIARAQLEWDEHGRASCFRRRHSVGVSGVPAALPLGVDFYFFFWGDDFDGIGFQPGGAFLWHSLPSGTGSTRGGQAEGVPHLGNLETCPLVVAGLGPGVQGVRFYGSAPGVAILKPQFSRSFSA